MASMMRRLLTGYAVWHNKRHKRKGHLFQNRYKSIIVEEEPYFLELVRYIHLNPIRAKLLTEMDQLDSNLYTGHAVILGTRRYDGQDVDWVLSWFGRQVGQARRKYRAFVMAGFHQGVREELRGGGLIRSAGGHEKLTTFSKEERERGDERILGGCSFVESIMERREKKKTGKSTSVDHVLIDVCRISQIPKELILSRSRIRRVSSARRLFLLRAHEETGASYTTLGRFCGLAHTSVKQAIEKARTENNEKNN